MRDGTPDGGRRPRAPHRLAGRRSPPPSSASPLRAEALGRPRLLADLTEAISAEGVGIVAAEVEPPQERRVRHTYTVELAAPGTLGALMRAMRGVAGVYDVYRTRQSLAASPG